MSLVRKTLRYKSLILPFCESVWGFTRRCCLVRNQRFGTACVPSSGFQCAHCDPEALEKRKRWSEVKRMVRDWTRWRRFVDALCPIRDNRRWWWWWWWWWWWLWSRGPKRWSLTEKRRRVKTQKLLYNKTTGAKAFSRINVYVSYKVQNIRYQMVNSEYKCE